jgi:hypothetical protein
LRSGVPDNGSDLTPEPHRESVSYNQVISTALLMLRRSIHKLDGKIGVMYFRLLDPSTAAMSTGERADMSAAIKETGRGFYDAADHIFPAEPDAKGTP